MKSPSELETVFSFRFTGGLASDGELNFYELSRSQYGAARLLYTLARYQEEGRVFSKITGKVNADIRARTGREGSYIYDAFVFLSVATAQSAVSVPLDALFVMVWDHLLSPFKAWPAVQSEAKLEAKRIEAKSRHALSREETKQLEILREIEHDKEITKRDALKAMRSISRDLNERPDVSQTHKNNVSIIIGDLQCEIRRDQIIAKHQRELSKIPEPDKENWQAEQES